MHSDVLSSPRSLQLPTWQLLLVLVGFPLIYVANSFSPWSLGFFLRGERHWMPYFLASIIMLHWTSVAVAAYLVLRSGSPLSAIGFRMRPMGIVVFTLTTFAAGAGMIWLRSTWGASSEPLPDWAWFYPQTLNERIGWLLVSFSAGFCEEFVYRGFAIRSLQERGLRTWKAVALACVSFVFIHGVSAVFLFPMLIPAALIFSAIFLWRKRLAPGMYLHTLWDMMGVMAV